MNTGGPAFPVPVDGATDGRTHDAGMTLLDWYAGQLLTGYVAHNGVSGNFDQHAKDCYDLASAMLAEKARREAVVQECSTTADSGKVAELQAANRELVEALELAERTFSSTQYDRGQTRRAIRAILAKHKGAK